MTSIATKVILGAFYFKLHTREDAMTPPSRNISEEDEDSGEMSVKAGGTPFRPSLARSNVAKGFYGVVFLGYVSSNFLILLFNGWPLPGADGTDVAFPGYWFPAMLGAVLLFSAMYYVLVFGTAARIYPLQTGTSPAGLPLDGGEAAVPTLPPVTEDGLLSGPKGWSFLSLANVECEVVKDRYYNDNIERVYRFGRRWRIVYYLPGERNAVSDYFSTTLSNYLRSLV